MRPVLTRKMVWLWWCSAGSLEFLANTWEVVFDKNCTLHVDVLGKRWKLVQWHLHNAEHSINGCVRLRETIHGRCCVWCAVTHEGIRLTLFFFLSDSMYYPLEVHMVHQNAEGDLMVIGVFLVRP